MEGRLETEYAGELPSLASLVRSQDLKLGSLLAVRFILWLLGAVSVIAVLRIALVGG